MERPFGVKVVVGWNVLMILVLAADMGYLTYLYFTVDVSDVFAVSGRGDEYDKYAQEAAAAAAQGLRDSVFSLMLVAYAVGLVFSATYGLFAWGLWGLRRWALWGEVGVSALTVLMIAGGFLLGALALLEVVRLVVNLAIIGYLYRVRVVFSAA